MFIIQICSNHMLEHHCHCSYKGIAYDGCFFYLSNPHEKTIAKYNLTFSFMEEFDVQRRYTSLCYSEKKECFFALTSDETDCIYVLDRKFQERDKISVKNVNMGVRYNNITGVTCGENGQIVVCGNFGIAEIDRGNSLKVSIIDQPKNAIQFTSIARVWEEYICTFKQSHCQLVGMFGGCNNEQMQCHIPEQFCVEDITEFVCTKDCCKIFYILVRKGEGCSCILKIKVCCGKDSEQSTCDILESIALVETAIAHILNAEGEKIQKILCVSDDPCEILKVNEMVNQTLVHVTQLESVLCEKLKIASKLCYSE